MGLSYASKCFSLALAIFSVSGSAQCLFSQRVDDNTNWKLVWSDEFNYNGLPDNTKWNYDTVGNVYGWGNNEKQWYDVAKLKNTEVNKGTLKIRALKDSSGNKAYTSGRLTTKYKGDWKYCRVDVKAKLPAGRGTWPAIWMLSTHNVYGNWPNSGEIDIMEHVGFDPDSVFATAHTKDFNHLKRTQVGKKTYLPTATTDFHVYRLEWDEHEYRCFVDDLHYLTFKNDGKGYGSWPFDQPFHLILNVAIGGNLGGKKGIDDTRFPHVMEVDYVRVYQQDTINLASMIADRRVADADVVLPPSWAFGVLYGGYTNQEQTLQRVDEIKRRNYPIDAYWIDSWFWDYINHGKGPAKYIDFVADSIAYPNRSKMWQSLEKDGIKGGFWIWDCIQQTGNEIAFDDFKQKGFFRDIYNNTNSWHNSSTTTAMYENGTQKRSTPTGNIDFKNPAAVAYFKQRMKHFFDEGADFLKLDRTSSIEVCKAMFEMTQEFGKETKGRGFILSHTGGQESPEYKRYPTKWTDDTRSDWNIETPLIDFPSWIPKVALKENIAMHLDPSKRSSEIPFLTNDLGGFDKGKTTQPEEELYIRWMQFSMMNAITEVFSQPENPTANMAWNFGSRADSLFRKYAHLRMQLFPYIYSHAHLARIAGKHIFGKIPGHIYQYTFGNELLLAPVYEKGATTKDVILPEGHWVNYWTGERMDGNRKYTVAAPIEQIPMFVKSGSIIPMRNYASTIEKGNNQTLNVSVYPGADGSFYLIEDDGSSNAYLTGGYAATVIEHKHADKKTQIVVQAVDGKYEGMPATRNWQIKMMDSRKPSTVTCNGKKLKFSTPEGKMTEVVLDAKKVNEKFLLEIIYP
jgi:beta-glucanase (GH16 family)